MNKKEIWSWVKSLAIAVILALIIRGNVLAFYVVDGSSMTPTLRNGQMVAVNKLVYTLGEPDYGDVIVFFSRSPLTGEKRELIKRVVALPGDIITIADGLLYVNNELVMEDYVDFQMTDNYGPVELLPGEIFVLGDNRRPAGSYDSREFDAVELKDVIGRADFVIFPIPGKVR